MNCWPELRPEIAAQVEAAVARGNKIEAIKIYREATNCGLKEAKDAVERGEPLRPAGMAAGSGGSSWFLIVVGAAIFVIVATIALLKAMR